MKKSEGGVTLMMPFKVHAVVADGIYLCFEDRRGSPITATHSRRVVLLLIRWIRTEV